MGYKLIRLTSSWTRNKGFALYLILGQCQNTNGRECRFPFEHGKIKHYSCSKTKSKVFNGCLTKLDDIALNNCDSRCKEAHSKCQNNVCVDSVNRLGMGV